MSLLEVSGLKKTYKGRLGGASVEALKNVNFTVEKGEYVAIMGESGSGKTTLLNILAALDKATSGTVILDGMNLTTIKDADIAQVSSEYIRQQILQQASATLLATANQTPSIALQLL